MSEQLWTPGQPDPAAARQSEVERALRMGREGAAEETPDVKEMRLNRRANKSKTGAQTNLRFATGRPRDPMFYWKDNNLPYDINQPEQLKELRDLCRTLYLTHPVIASAIDIFSKFPLTGMEFVCLASETMVVTDQGTLPIADLAGGTHRVITSTGHWVDADFDSYGTQQLLRLTVRRNRREQVIYATPEHRWFVENTSRDSTRGRSRRSEVTTADLAPGQRLATVHAINRVQNTTPSSIGVAHGIVFGDGSVKGRRKNEGYINLYGDKNIDLLRFFPEPNIRKWRPEGYNVDAVTVYDLPGYFKSLPPLDESTSYLYGWLAGYFAADGTVSKKGECILYSASREHIDFAQTVCHRLGIRTSMPYEVERTNSKADGPHTLWYLPLDAGSLTGEFFVTAEHRLRWLARQERGFATKGDLWTVVSVEETDRVEEVYCAKVSGTESFVLEGNVLTGNCKDADLSEFYTELFIEELEYPEFLIDVGREYWTAGEAWPLGSFNEVLGVWEDDELINPDDVQVIRSPFLKEPRFEMKLPETIRTIIENREPEWEFRQLVNNYPELVNYAHRNDALMPVSSILLKQLKFKGDTFHSRGIPLLLRGLRAIMQEEMLNAAQDAVASRLYTPMILAKLGATANELGTQQPWIPDAGDLQDFEEAVDAALAGDFRMLTYHFAVNMQSVFGRETMPRMEQDFDRLTDRILQVFGLSRTMLSGSERGQTYAADALNRDLITQLLSTYQRRLKRFVRDRMLVVAEAQEHYDYEMKGGKRIPIMEEVLEVDPETGAQRIVEQPKLLVPDLQIRAMNLRDEDSYRQFIEALRNQGVPISMNTRLTNVPIDLDDEVERVREEQIEQAIEAQRTRKETYQALRREGLPIPQDLKDDFEPKATEGLPGGASTPEEGDPHTPTIGEVEPASTEALVPTEEGGLSNGDQSPSSGEEGTVVELPRNRQRQRPPESDEQRANMPKPASLVEVTEPIVREAADDDEDEGVEEEIEVMRYRTPDGKDAMGRLTRGPQHIGMRRHADLDPNEDLHEQLAARRAGDAPDG